MGLTGEDIFRMSTLIHTMCTCPTYLDPLRSFRKRIAYANAYKTDFVVPTNTAAFLNPDSTYPHHVSEEIKDDSETVDGGETNGMVVATFHTPQSAIINQISKNGPNDKIENSGTASFSEVCDFSCILNIDNNLCCHFSHFIFQEK